MIALQPISVDYTELLMLKYEMSKDDAKKLITQSETELLNNKYFKMFAILNNEMCVGIVSLYEHSASVISIGPEIFEEYRNCGYATEAMKIAMNIVKTKGYKIVCQQIRTNNAASIQLHTKLGFETDNYSFFNKNKNEVVIYLKTL